MKTKEMKKYLVEQMKEHDKLVSIKIKVSVLEGLERIRDLFGGKNGGSVLDEYLVFEYNFKTSDVDVKSMQKINGYEENDESLVLGWLKMKDWCVERCVPIDDDMIKMAMYSMAENGALREEFYGE